MPTHPRGPPSASDRRPFRHLPAGKRHWALRSGISMTVPSDPRTNVLGLTPAEPQPRVPSAPSFPRVRLPCQGQDQSNGRRPSSPTAPVCVTFLSVPSQTATHRVTQRNTRVPPSRSGPGVWSGPGAEAQGPHAGPAFLKPPRLLQPVGAPTAAPEAPGRAPWD